MKYPDGLSRRELFLLALWAPDSYYSETIREWIDKRLWRKNP